MTSFDELPPEIVSLIAVQLYNKSQLHDLIWFSLCSKACRTASIPVLFENQHLSTPIEAWDQSRNTHIRAACRTLSLVLPHSHLMPTLPDYRKAFPGVQNLCLTVIAGSKEPVALQYKESAQPACTRPLKRLRLLRTSLIEPPLHWIDSNFADFQHLHYLDLELWALQFIRTANSFGASCMPHLRALKISESRVMLSDLQVFVRNHKRIAQLSIIDCALLEIIDVLSTLQEDLPDLSSLRMKRSNDFLDNPDLPTIPPRGFSFPKLERLSLEDGDDDWLPSVHSREDVASNTIDIIHSIIAPNLTHLYLFWLLSEASTADFVRLLHRLSDGSLPKLSVLTAADKVASDADMRQSENYRAMRDALERMGRPIECEVGTNVDSLEGYGAEQNIF